MSRLGSFLAPALLSLAAAFGQSAPPAITSQPASTIANAGQSVTLSLTATGSPTPTIQWFKDGKAITSATNSYLTFASVFGGDAGTYTATVSNVYNGSTYTLTTIPAVLTVITTPPTITMQPVSQTVVAGGDVTFSVSATGSEQMSYRWYRDGAEISGATESAFRIRTSSLTDAGTYQVIVSNWSNQIISASSSSWNSIFVMGDGTLWGTGVNSFGQLGDGTVSNRYTAVPVASGVDTAKLSIPAYGPNGWLSDYSVFIKKDGSLWGMGKNDYGQLGDGTTNSRVAPVQIANEVINVSLADTYTMFIKKDGSLWGTGRNDYGQLGDGTTNNRSTPARIASGVVNVWPADTFTIFLKKDGSLWGMGRNQAGQLGDDSRSNRPEPVWIAGGVATAWAVRRQTMHPISDEQTLFLKIDGTLWGTGVNNYGQLGAGSATMRLTPAQIATNVVSVSPTGSYTMFIKSDGTLWGMGRQELGQLGDGTTNDRSEPAQVATEVSSVWPSVFHTLFLKKNGTLWAMGFNAYGQLGDGTQSNRLLPIKVADEVVTASVSKYSTMFLRNDGSLWGMGRNEYGQLGDGSTTNREVPVQVATGVASMSTYDLHTTFLKKDGTLWGMGRNEYGQLGDGTMAIAVVRPKKMGGGLPSSAAILSVLTPPIITTHPSTQTVTAGFPINLAVITKGNPPPNYQWRKSGNNIPNATNASYTISSATIGDAGTYTVVVTNSVGIVTSNEAIVTVNPAAPASISVQPTNVTANLGQSATLSVTVSGSPAPAIQWFKNGAAISSATDATYTISSVSQSDAATYTATVQNVYNGTTYSLTTSAAVLTVIAAPIFTTQPLSRTVLAGTQVTFTAAVQGLAATTFQWRKNGTAIDGATGGSYSITSTVTSDSGTYTVVATNGEGSTTSNPAELVINAVVPPTISGAPANVTIPNGERTQLKVTATGVGTLTYQWYQGQSGSTTNPVNGATGATFTTPALTATTSYWVRVTDSNGGVTNGPTATVTVSATSPLAVSQTVLGHGYIAGGAVTVTNTITYSGTAPSRIDWSTLLPTGWKYLGSGGSEGGVRPIYKNADLIEWSWTTVPPSPIEFTYTVSVPAGTTGDQVIASLVTSQAAGTNYQTMAKPDPLVIRSASLHTADSNRDGRISLTELTRVIELYNYRSGTTRTGQYKPQSGTEDGFTPGP